jgi:hypothetical protein
LAISVNGVHMEVIPWQFRGVARPPEPIVAGAV